jgi:hypothetical protein
MELKLTKSKGTTTLVFYVSEQRYADAEKLVESAELKAVFQKFGFPIEAVVKSSVRALQH